MLCHLCCRRLYPYHFGNCSNRPQRIHCLNSRRRDIQMCIRDSLCTDLLEPLRLIHSGGYLIPLHEELEVGLFFFGQVGDIVRCRNEFQLSLIHIYCAVQPAGASLRCLCLRCMKQYISGGSSVKLHLEADVFAAAVIQTDHRIIELRLLRRVKPGHCLLYTSRCV